MYEDEIYHYGVKGMHWGVRRDQLRKGIEKRRAAAAKKKATKQQTANIVKDRRRALSNRRVMSDAELKKRIGRLRLEQDFKNLQTNDLKTGEHRVRKALANRGNTMLVTAITVGATLAAREGLRIAIAKAPIKNEDIRNTLNKGINAMLPIGGGGKKKK